MSTAEAIEKDIEALRGQIRAFKLQLKTIRTEIIRRRFEELKSGIAGLAPAAPAATPLELPRISLRGAEFRGVPFPTEPMLTPTLTPAPAPQFGAFAPAAPTALKGSTNFDQNLGVRIFIPSGASGVVVLPVGVSAAVIAQAKAQNPGASIQVGGVDV